MISTITLNPCLDKHISVRDLKLNETNRWVKLRHYAGGKGIDVSRAIHVMGGQSMAYGFIGGREGRNLEIMLAEDGVPFSLTPIRNETRTCFIITDTKNRQQTSINAPGPQVSKKEIESFFTRLWQVSTKPKLIVAAGSVPPGVPDNIYAAIIKDARQHNVKTILDSTNIWLKEGIKAKPFLIKPNVREAEELLKTDLTTEDDIIKAACHLAAKKVEIAVISRGKDGIIAANGENIIRATPPPVKVKSTIGAGDSAVAGLAIKLAEGRSLAEACRLAVAMGTAAVLTPGTELCHREDVEKLLPQIKIEKMAAACKPHNLATRTT